MLQPQGRSPTDRYTPEAPASPSCLTQIENAYGQMRGTLRQVANLLLRSPHSYVGKSISTLARDSQVSVATVIRFVRTLGYSGFREFSIALATASVSVTPRKADLPSEMLDEHNLSGVVRKVFAFEAQALIESPKTLQSEILEKVVEELIKARRVYCYAVDSSGSLVAEAEYQFVRLNIDCVAIRDSIQFALHASFMNSNDVLICFSQTGRNRAAVQVLKMAHKTGVTTIGVTTEPGSPLVQSSDIALVLFEFGGLYNRALLGSKIPELTLISALAQCIATRTKSGTDQSINLTDQRIAELVFEQSKWAAKSEKDATKDNTNRRGDVIGD